MQVTNFGNKWSIPWILFYSLSWPQQPTFSWKDWQRCGFNFHTVFHILRPWNKSYCVCIRCAVIFISTYHKNEFREDANICIIKIKRDGNLGSVLLRQNQIYYLLCLNYLCNKDWENQRKSTVLLWRAGVGLLCHSQTDVLAAEERDQMQTPQLWKHLNVNV